MPGNEHFLFKQEAVWGTYVDPDLALPVTSATPNPAQPPLANEDTGSGRGQRPSLPGAKTVEGPVMTKLYGKTLGKLLRSMYADRVAAAAGTGWLNKLLTDDDVDFDSFSFQKRYTAAYGESIRGAKLNGYTITARSREFASAELRWVAKDAGSTVRGFEDGTIPGVVDPPIYASAMPDPLKFNQGILRLGGTPSLTSGAVVIAGGTDRCDFDNVQLEVNNNLSNDAFGICIGDPTVQSVDEGVRTVTLRFEPNHATVLEEFYDKWGSGEDLTAELFFQSTVEYNGGYKYEFKWGMPLVRVTSAPNPELNRRFGLKRQTVECTAYVDDDLAIGLDHGLQIQTTEDLTA